MNTATMPIAGFQLYPVDSSLLDAARATGVDASGNQVEQVVASGGEPLRCCFRDAVPGERCILFGYEPPIPSSPYREVGAIFAHADQCNGPASLVEYPAAWRGRPQVLRAYDERGWIHASTRVHDGCNPEAVIAEILCDPEVKQIHSRNVAYGCFMFAVGRRS